MLDACLDLAWVFPVTFQRWDCTNYVLCVIQRCDRSIYNFLWIERYYIYQKEIVRAIVWIPSCTDVNVSHIVHDIPKYSVVPSVVCECSKLHAGNTSIFGVFGVEIGSMPFHWQDLSRFFRASQYFPATSCSNTSGCCGAEYCIAMHQYFCILATFNMPQYF